MKTFTEEVLTQPQQKTLREIQKFIDERGFPPTVEELAARLKVTKATVHGSLDRLMQKGFLRRTHGKARSIEIVRTPTASVIDVVAIPLLGDVPAGIPINTQENHAGQVFVQVNVVGNDPCFALNVVGNSMIGADIRDGDTVIVRQQPLAENGDIVVASIDGEVTVKRLAMEKGKIRLLPENDEFTAIDVVADHDLRILGRVIATRRVVKQGDN
ncbi:MAG: transcriptional repressor LexA [Pirellulaceae bacterium]